MSPLNDENIAFVKEDLNRRGLILDGLQDELLDHVCSAVEEKMAAGMRFMDAYQEVIKAFGNSKGLQSTQKEVIRTKNQTTPLMLKNNLTIAWRSLHRQGFYAVMTMAGLAIGVAACLVIALFVKDELSYDRSYSTSDRVVRLNNDVRFGDNFFKMATSAAPVAALLQQNYPEIESTVRLVSYGTYLVSTGKGEESIKEDNVRWADSTFFRVFDFNIVTGNARTALSEPNSIAISRRIAQKYFPNGNALGETLILDRVYNAKITAVFEDTPANNHLHFDILISMYGDWPVPREARSTSFNNKNFYTYLLLHKGAKPAALEAKFPAFVKKYINPGPASADNYTRLSLMAATDIHLYGKMGNELEANGDIQYLYLFGMIALFIMLIACINFMNMSTARSGTRAKEVGVRKVLGSLRTQLMRQFLTESVLITAASCIVAVGLTFAILPAFNHFSGKDLTMPLANPLFYGLLIVMTLTVGCLAGIYPSFFLSAGRPIHILKGNGASGMKSSVVRSALIVFQFIISISLIIGAIAVNLQLDFIQHKNLGFQKEKVLLIKDAYALRPNIESFKNQVSAISNVENCSVSGFVPIESPEASRSDRTYWADGKEPEAQNFVSLQTWFIDYDYFSTLGMSVVQGREFSKAFPSDKTALVLNETAVKRLNLGDNPIGKKIRTFSDHGNEADFEHPIAQTIVGVVKDFHFSSMKETIQPLAFSIQQSDGFVMVKLHTAAPETIESIRKVWKSIAPEQPFQWSFMNDDFGRMYAAEIRLGQIFNIFSGLAILIACLGLFAMTAFTTSQRNKEIGIRKVLGATVENIVVLLSADLSKLVLIAFALSIPIAWYGVTRWLETYSYRTEIGPLVYLLAGLLTLAIALLTISSQSIRAAKANPTETLRSV